MSNRNSGGISRNGQALVVSMFDNTNVVDEVVIKYWWGVFTADVGCGGATGLSKSRLLLVVPADLGLKSKESKRRGIGENRRNTELSKSNSRWRYRLMIPERYNRHQIVNTES